MTSPKAGNFKQRRVHHQTWWKKLVLLPLYGLLVVWNRTLRIRFEGNSQLLFQLADQPYLLVGWHNTLFVAPLAIRHMRKEHTVCGLVSASKDGAWLVAMFDLLGFKYVRGSANFRGAQSLKELIRVARNGWDLAITPDGSKGPAYVMKPGSAAVARVCGMGILLVGIEFHNAWRLQSWDRFFVPKPFSAVSVRVERIGSYAELGKEDPHEATLELQRRLMRLQPEDPLIPDPAADGKQ